MPPGRAKDVFARAGRSGYDDRSEMRSYPPKASGFPPPDDPLGIAGRYEIVIPHESSAGRVTGVRNVLLQASLAELKAHGHYERYAMEIEPGALELLLSSLAPGWISVQLAMAHYEACEKLNLSREEFEAMGERVGDRVQETVLVSSAKKEHAEPYDLWLALPSLHRMWPRLFQGGSVQITKIGTKEKLLEERGFVLTRYHYHRQGHLAALRSTYGALGVHLTTTKIVSYDAGHDEMVIRVAWL